MTNREINVAQKKYNKRMKDRLRGKNSSSISFSMSEENKRLRMLDGLADAFRLSSRLEVITETFRRKNKKT